MNESGRFLPTATLALFLTGCAATPALDIRPLTPALAADGAIPFRLTDAVIALGVEADNSGSDKPAPPISFAKTYVGCPGRGATDKKGCEPAVYPVVAPAEFTAATYAITTRSQNLVETRVAPTYATNSLRLAELAVEVKDHRMEVINAIGAVAAGIAANQAGNVGGGPAKTVLQLPVIIDGADARAPDSPDAQCRPAPTGPGAGGCHPLPGNPDWSYRLIATDDPAAQGFIARADIATVRDVMVASICRPAVLAIDHSDVQGVRPMLTLRLTVVDPEWLSTMQLPAKGQLVFHPLCGMDLKRQQVTETGVDAMTRAVFDQIAAVRAAAK
jgi:hypothetical protein